MPCSNEERYRHIFNCSPDPVFLISTEAEDDGLIVDANDAATKVLGYTRAEFLRMRLREMTAPSGAEQIDERIRRMMAGEVLRFEVVRRAKDGADVPVEVSSRCVEIGGRKFVLSFNHDLSRRRRADGAVRVAEARWRFALESAGDGVWDWDVATNEVFYSPRWKAMLGYSEDEVEPGLSAWKRLVHPEDLEPALAAVNAHFRGESDGVVVEHRMRCKDGSWKWIRARGRVTEWIEPGRPRRMMGTHTDIDQERRRDELLRSLNLRFQLALGAGRLGTFQRNFATGESSWDARCWEFVGRPAQPRGPTWEELKEILLPTSLAAYQAAVDQARQGARSVSVELTVRRPSGELRSLVLHAEAHATAEPGGLVLTGVVEDATEKQEVERARRTAWERYTTIFSAVAEGVALHRSDGSIIECNPAAEKILGLTRDQILGRTEKDPRWRLVGPGGSDVRPEEIPSVIAQQTGRSVREREIGVHRPDGSLAWLLVNAEPIHGLDGSVTNVVASFADITAQRQAEAEKRRLDEKFHAAVISSRTVWWEWNLVSGKLTVSSAGAPCILGYEDQQVLGLSKMAWLERTHPSDRARVERSLGDTLAGRNDQWACEHRLRAADGSWRWVRQSGKVIEREPDSQPRLMVGTTQDIHQAHVSEERFQETAEGLGLALTASRMGIWRRNLQTEEVHWDERTCAFYGIAGDQIPRDEAAFMAFVHPDDRKSVAEARAAMRAGQSQFEFSFRILRPDGTTRHIRSVGSVHRDDQGRPEWVTGINEDITEKIEAANKRADLEKHLLQAQKLETLGTLAGGIAHDFNNLLTGVIGFVELALKAVPSDGEAGNYLRHARGGSLRARELVKRLLLFARKVPETNRQPLVLSQLIAETVPLLSATLPASISIRTEVKSGVGSVLADPGQMQQILMNLCVNAAHAIGTKQGNITLGLEIAAESALAAIGAAPGGYVRLSVRDDGCGMDETTRARIFDPFFTTKTQGEGTGLGLAIVHGIVTEHGGKIRVFSQPGRGTTFELFFPLAASAGPTPATPVAVSTPVKGAGRRVLLADDEEYVRTYVATLLRRSGFAVDTFADGRGAVLHFALQPEAYVLAVVDLSMPGRTGYDVITELRRRRADLPIVLISGDHDRYGASPHAGAANFIRLNKPFTPEELLVAVRPLLPADAAAKVGST